MPSRSMGDCTAPAGGGEQTPRLSPPGQFSPRSCRGLSWPTKYGWRIPRPAAWQQPQAALAAPCPHLPAGRPPPALPTAAWCRFRSGKGSVSNGAVSGKAPSH